MTLLAPVKFAPVIVTAVAPAKGPVFGFTVVISGVGNVEPRNPFTVALGSLIQWAPRLVALTK